MTSLGRRLSFVMSWLCALAALAWPMTQETSTSPEVREFLTECSAKMSDVETLRIRFVQTKQLKILRRPKRSQGSVFLKGNRLHMIVFGEDETQRETELFVDGDQARIYYPRLKLLEIYELEGGTAAPTPFPVFGSDLASLEQAYAIRIDRRSAQEVDLHMTPRDPESPIKEVRLRFREHQVAAMEQINDTGDRVLLEVVEYAVNPVIPDEMLELRTHPDTKIVRPLKARGRPHG